MKLEHEQPDTQIYVKHYRPGELILSHQSLFNSVIITPDKIIDRKWDVHSVSKLTLEAVEPLFELNAHIHLLGTGKSGLIPPQEIIVAFARLGKSIDFMNSAAACRTFNILANEGRHVVAAIIV